MKTIFGSYIICLYAQAAIIIIVLFETKIKILIANQHVTQYKLHGGFETRNIMATVQNEVVLQYSYSVCHIISAKAYILLI